MSPHAAKRICPETGRPFTPHHGLQTFSTDACRKAFYDRQAKRAKTHLALFQVAGDRHGNAELRAYARREMDRLLVAWNAEDRAAGRRPDILIENKMRQGWKAGDGPGWRAAVLAG